MIRTASTWIVAILVGLVGVAQLQNVLQILSGNSEGLTKVFRPSVIVVVSLAGGLLFLGWSAYLFRGSDKAYAFALTAVLWLLLVAVIGAAVPSVFYQNEFAGTSPVRLPQLAIWFAILAGLAVWTKLLVRK